jgi:hypothetical protein
MNYLTSQSELEGHHVFDTSCQFNFAVVEGGATFVEMSKYKC